MATTTAYTEQEYSKLWIASNPSLFADFVLEFLGNHDKSNWDLSVRQTDGFLYLKASFKEKT